MRAGRASWTKQLQHFLLMNNVFYIIGVIVVVVVILKFVGLW